MASPPSTQNQLMLKNMS